VIVLEAATTMRTLYLGLAAGIGTRALPARYDLIAAPARWWWGSPECFGFKEIQNENGFTCFPVWEAGHSAGNSECSCSGPSWSGWWSRPLWRASSTWWVAGS